MALSERVAVNPDHLRGNDGTVRNAMMVWSARNGPVLYNPWQSLFFALKRDFQLRDEESTPGESQQELARRIRRYYNEIQQELHGPVSYTHLTLPTSPKV